MWDPAHVTLRVKLYYIPSFRSVAPMVFLAKIPFLAFSQYYGNHFPDFFSSCFKLGQNLSSGQVSEKSTYRFGQNGGTDRPDGQTDRQTDR